MADLAQEQALDKVDIIRSRFPITYREAYDTLERNEGNVVRALMELEDHKLNPGLLEQVEERVTVMGHEVVSKVLEAVRTGQTSKVRIMRDGRTIWTLPTAVGAVSALLFPYVTLFATVAAVSQKYEIVLDKRKPQQRQQQQSQTTLTHCPGEVNVHHEAVVAEYARQ